MRINRVFLQIYIIFRYKIVQKEMELFFGLSRQKTQS